MFKGPQGMSLAGNAAAAAAAATADVCLFVWEGEPVSAYDYRFRTPGSSRSFLPLMGDWNLFFILGIVKRRIESVCTSSRRIKEVGGYINTI